MARGNEETVNTKSSKLLSRKINVQDDYELPVQKPQDFSQKRSEKDRTLFLKTLQEASKKRTLLEADESKRSLRGIVYSDALDLQEAVLRLIYKAGTTGYLRLPLSG
jgi:hypothetical protein